jgi:hypothetical protein
VGNLCAGGEHKILGFDKEVRHVGTAAKKLEFCGAITRKLMFLQVK